MKDLNKLSKEIYEANKAKGFHEVKESPEHLLCLVISELMEAVEADRKGIKANIEHIEILTKTTSKSLFDVLFKNGIKDSVEDELADAVIRLLDTAGALELNVVLIYTNLSISIIGSSFTEKIYGIVRAMAVNNVKVSIPYAITRIETLCKELDIDLWKHVELKLKYNSLRPYKHGKAY